MKMGIATRLPLIAALLVLLGTLLIGWVFTRDAGEVLRDISYERVDAAVDRQAVFLDYVLDGAERDLLQLLSVRSLREFADGSALAEDRIAEHFQSTLLKQDWYLQVRLLNRFDNGKELVRVDRVADQAVVTPKDQLQYKGHRDYFRQSLRLPNGTVYYSKLNLNREFSQIQEPHFPTLRLVSPLVNAKGEAVALVIINFDMQKVFDRLGSGIPERSQLLLANARGDFLLHPEAERGFAFEFGSSPGLFDDFKGLDPQQFSENFSLAQRHALRVVQADFVSSFHRIAMPGVGPERFLYLGISEPLSWVSREVEHLTERSFLLAMLFGLGGVVVVWTILKRLVSPLKTITDAVASFEDDKPLPPLPSEREDELGVLAQAFEHMAMRIQYQIESIRNEHERLDTLIETIADPIILIDQRGIMLRVNSATSRFFGYDEKELVGENVSMLMNAGDAAMHDGYLKQFVETGEAHVIGRGREVVGRHKYGKSLRLYLSIGQFVEDGEMHFTGILHDLSERLALEDQLRTMAYNDVLTGVYNRRYIVEQLAHEVRAQERYGSVPALLLIDLDRFKCINDQWGHEAGDKALRLAVSLIQEGVREVDTLARFGGDEFMVLMPHTQLNDAFNAAQRLCARAPSVVLVAEENIALSLSIGVAIHQSGNSVDEWIRHADNALYRAKEVGRGVAQVEPEFDQQLAG